MSESDFSEAGDNEKENERRGAIVKAKKEINWEDRSDECVFYVSLHQRI